MKNKNIKFVVCSKHKACSFCGVKEIPVVMEMKTGQAICQACIDIVKSAMEYTVPIAPKLLSWDGKNVNH